MVFCHCSLAGTAACKHCANNPNAEPSPYRTYTTTTTTGYPVQTNNTGYVCRETGWPCGYATEYGFCQLTACAYHYYHSYSFKPKEDSIQDLIDKATEAFREQLEEIVRNKKS